MFDMSVYVLSLLLINLISITIYRSYLLSVLLLLEGLTLLLLFSCLICLGGPSLHHIYLLLGILVMGAAEAGLGLSLMVILSRKSGNNMLFSLTMSKC